MLIYKHKFRQFSHWIRPLTDVYMMYILAAIMSTSSQSLSAHATRQRIALASMAVFADRGLKDARVQDILEAAGVSRRTFYRHFSDKHAALEGVYLLTRDALLDAFNSIEAAEESAWTALNSLLDAYFEFHRSDRGLLRILVEEALRSDSRLSPHRIQFRQTILDRIDRAAVELRGQALDPYVGVALMAALEGLSLEILRAPTDIHAIDRARAAIRTLLGAALGDAPRLQEAP